MDRVADTLRRLLPHLLRIGLYGFVALVAVELLIAFGAASLRLLHNPGGMLLIALLWWWKRSGKRLL